MLEYQVNPNVKLVLRVQLGASDTGLFPQTTIYDEADGSVVDTVNLTHKAKGLYVGDWDNDGQRKRYYTQTIIYTDSYGGTESPIDRPDSDSLNVGFNTTGGVFGSAKSSVVKKDLTDEEINKIIDGVVKELKPIIEERSTFDPGVDIVKTDINVDLSPTLDKLEDIKNNMGDKDVLVKINNMLGLQDKTNNSMSKLVDNILIANKDSKHSLSSLVTKVVESNTELSQFISERIKDISLKDFNDNSKETISELKTLIEQNKNDGKAMNETFDKVKLFVGGSIYGNKAQQEKELLPNIIEDLEGGASALDIYYKIKKLPNKDKDKVLRLIKSKYPNILNKLNTLIK